MYYADIQRLVIARQNAINAKDTALVDKIELEIRAEGYELHDDQYGTHWTASNRPGNA